MPLAVSCLATYFSEAFAKEVFPAESWQTARVSAKVLRDENVTQGRSSKTTRQLTLQLCDQRFPDKNIECKCAASQVRLKNAPPKTGATPQTTGQGPQPSGAMAQQDTDLREEEDVVIMSEAEEETVEDPASNITWHLDLRWLNFSS